MRLFVIALLFALVTQFPSSLNAEDSHSEPTVGLLTELSGSFAANGADCRKGYDLAAELFKPISHETRKPHIVFGDTQGDPKTGITEMRKMISVDGAAAIVVNRSQVGMAMASVADQVGVPLIGVVGHSDFTRNHKYAFRAWPNAAREGETLAKTVFADGHRYIATITLEDEYLTSLTKNFTVTFENLGGKVAIAQSVLPADSDFASQITSLRKTDLDAIFVNLGIPQLGPFLKQLTQQRFAQPLYSNYWIQKPEVAQASGGATEGITFVEANLNVPNFLQEFRRRFGEPPNLMMSYTCFTAASTALGVASASGTETYEKLLQLKRITSPDGELPVLDREVEFPLVAKKIVAGKVVPLTRAGV